MRPVLLVEALRELDALLRVRAARVERAHGARELPDLEKNCTANGPRAERGTPPSAIRSQSGWRPKARPASIIARSSSTNARPGMGQRISRRRATAPGGAAAHRGLDLGPQRLGRTFDEQTRPIVVTHHEHLGCELHAFRVPLAEVLVDDDAHPRFSCRKADSGVNSASSGSAARSRPPPES